MLVTAEVCNYIFLTLLLLDLTDFLNIKFSKSTSVFRLSKETKVSVLVEDCRELTPNGSLTPLV